MEAIPRFIELGWMELVSEDGKDVSHDPRDIPEDRVRQHRSFTAPLPQEGAGLGPLDKRREEKSNIKPKPMPQSAAPTVADVNFELIPTDKPKSSKKRGDDPDTGLARLQEQWFDRDIWPLYWRKIERINALSVFKRHAKSLSLKDKIRAAILRERDEQLFREENKRTYFASWINRKGYLDAMDDPPAADFVTPVPPKPSPVTTALAELEKNDPCYFIKLLESKVKQGFIPAIELERAKKRLGARDE